MSRPTDAARWLQAQERKTYEAIEDRLATASGQLDLAKRAMLRLHQARERALRGMPVDDLLRPVELFFEAYGARAAEDMEAAQAAYRELTRGEAE